MDFIRRLSRNPGHSGNEVESTTDEMGAKKPETTLGNVLGLMDSFLEREDNLIVQSLAALEERTNISRRYLARGFLFLLGGYFVFSHSFLDIATHLLMFLYPSYRTYLLLKHSQPSVEDLMHLLKFWIFLGFYATFDFFLGFLLPFGSIFKFIAIVQCVLPQKSPAVDFFYQNMITPVFDYLEHNPQIRHFNQYFQTLTHNLQQETHQE